MTTHPRLSRREMNVLTVLANTQSTKGLSPLTVRKLHSLGLLYHDNRRYALSDSGHQLVRSADAVRKLPIDTLL